MLNYDNFKLVIKDYELQEIYVDGFYVDEEKLMGTPLWDTVQNVKSWLFYKRRIWSYKHQQFITLYPYRLIPADTELDKRLYEAFRQLVKEEINQTKEK